MTRGWWTISCLGAGVLALLLFFRLSPPPTYSPGGFSALTGYFPALPESVNPRLSSESHEAGVPSKGQDRAQNLSGAGVHAAPADTGRGPRRWFRWPDLAKIKQLTEIVQKYARLHEVDEDLVWAVMRAESGFNPRAVSPKGAMGLMQLMPGTASLMGVTDPFDVEQNIAGGVKYLEHCLSRFNQDISLALAAYNAGPENVAKYRGCPPFAETLNYVASVMGDYLGHPRPKGLKFALIGYTDDEEMGNETRDTGLPWRVPLPRWKVSGPQFSIKAPQWKVAWRSF